MSPANPPSSSSPQLPEAPIPAPALPVAAAEPHGFLRHARVISALTLLSRIFGVVRESIAARYFGAGPVSSAFAVAFTIPNLFRRLLGEGALSAAFIPLYSRAIQQHDEAEARRLASGAVNLLVLILIGLTLVGEGVLWILSFWEMPTDRRLALRLTAIMLPYLIFVCGAAFLGAILQVHRRFAAIAAAPIVLNFALIGSTLWGARLFGVATIAGQSAAMVLVSVSVLVAGAVQILMLAPSLREAGFKFDWRSALWTPAIRQMVALSIPVAMGAGVLQVSTLLDRGLSFLLAASPDASHFHFFGQLLRLPMAEGAAARLGWAQYLYQFPLGVFAIALATAIFPRLSADALAADRSQFRAGIRAGLAATLWEGLPASVGLIIVARPAVQLLFERGQFLPADTELTAYSVQIYSTAVWAYSMLQILNRAYYALHDTVTPLVLSILTLVINVAVELPLVWTKMGETGMAAGTAVSFVVQTFLMIWLLSRRVGGLDLRLLVGHLVRVTAATVLMAGACWVVVHCPLYPTDVTRHTALWRLTLLMGVGGGTYLGTGWVMGLRDVMPRRHPPAPEGRKTVAHGAKCN
jgi:putative peptidoglycan lipid II flippase